VLKTTSQLLSHHQNIEEKQAEFYTILAKTYPNHKEVFKRLERESRRHIDMAQRAYREGVTDAFEVGFLSNPINTEEYIIKEPKNSLSESVKVMISNEEIIINFCLDAASNSSRLLPDVSETFERLVKRKKRRIEKLKEVII
jgi:rubrerythrin